MMRSGSNAVIIDLLLKIDRIDEHKNVVKTVILDVMGVARLSGLKLPRKALVLYRNFRQMEIFWNFEHEKNR